MEGWVKIIKDCRSVPQRAAAEAAENIFLQGMLIQGIELWVLSLVP